MSLKQAMLWIRDRRGVIYFENSLPKGDLMVTIIIPPNSKVKNHSAYIGTGGSFVKAYKEVRSNWLKVNKKK